MTGTAIAPQFVCPTCGAASWHPDDRRHGYCGRCHAFTAAPGTGGGYRPPNPPPPLFVCPACTAESWHPGDRRYGYCGRCHDFTAAPDESMRYDVGAGTWTAG